MADVTRKTGPRACTTCAKAKARCVSISTTSLKCERCDRLNKPCSQQTPAPPRPRKAQRATRVAQLEQKLSDLAAQVHAVNGTPKDPSDPMGIEKRKKTILSFDFLFPGEKLNESEAAMVSSPTRQQHSPPSSSASSPPQTQSSVFWPECEEAEKMLDRYRRNQTHIFPFVMIPADTTSAWLRLERPFTWKAFMLQSCSNDGYRQHVLGKELLNDFSEALLTRPRKSLDLLQGLILFVAWHHAGLTSFQATNLLGLARSLCFSLGLHEGQIRELDMNPSPACLEQLRAFAGTYYLITSFYTTSKRTDAFMNTTYLDLLCRVLDNKAQYPTDKLAAHLVKVQQLAQNISLTLSSNTSSQLFLLPTTMVVKNLQSQIENLKANLPADLRENIVLVSHLHTAETLLYEVGLQDVGAEMGGLQGTDRLEVLWSLFTSLKAFLALRIDKSGRGCHRFPCISSVDFMYNFLTCLKLITLQAPGWDLARIRRDLALPDQADHQIQELERLIHMRKRGNNEGTGQEQPYEDPLQRLATTLKGISSVLRAMPEPGPMTPLVQNDTQSNTEDADLLDLEIVSTLVPDAWSGFWAPEDQTFDGDWNSETTPLNLSSV